MYRNVSLFLIDGYQKKPYDFVIFRKLKETYLTLKHGREQYH